MKIGSVVSLPERKKARRNSSNEVVKESSRLATTPGTASGKVTRQKVDQPVSPRSSEASSRLLSKPSSRDISTSIENGTHTSTWAAPMVNSDRLSPRTWRPNARDRTSAVQGKRGYE